MATEREEIEEQLATDEKSLLLLKHRENMVKGRLRRIKVLRRKINKRVPGLQARLEMLQGEGDFEEITEDNLDQKLVAPVVDPVVDSEA